MSNYQTGGTPPPCVIDNPPPRCQDISVNLVGDAALAVYTNGVPYTDTNGVDYIFWDEVALLNFIENKQFPWQEGGDRVRYGTGQHNAQITEVSLLNWAKNAAVTYCDGITDELTFTTTLVDPKVNYLDEGGSIVNFYDTGIKESCKNGFEGVYVPLGGAVSISLCVCELKGRMAPFAESGAKTVAVGATLAYDLSIPFVNSFSPLGLPLVNYRIAPTYLDYSNSFSLFSTVKDVPLDPTDGNFTITGIAPGTATVGFDVMDSEGRWSNVGVCTVTVTP